MTTRVKVEKEDSIQTASNTNVNMNSVTNKGAIKQNNEDNMVTNKPHANTIGPTVITETKKAPTIIEIYNNMKPHPVAPKKPIFDSETSNPITFVKEMKHYISRMKAKDRENMGLKEIVLDCITGPALWVMDSFSNGWNNFGDFANDFLDAFWGETQQNEVRNKLLNFSWTPNGRTTMTEHFIEMRDLSIALKGRSDDATIVNCIMRHYDVLIQIGWFACNQKPPTFRNGYEFIKNVENNVRFPNSEPKNSLALQSDISRFSKRVSVKRSNPTTEDKLKDVAEKLNNISQLQLKDPFLAKTIEKIKTGDQMEMKSGIGVYKMKDDKLIYVWQHFDKEVLVIPRFLREQVIYAVHEEAEHCAEKTEVLVHKRYYFYAMKVVINKVLSDCKTCRRAKTRRLN